MKTNNFRSPLFYMGDKFKLLDQLKERFPKKLIILLSHLLVVEVYFLILKQINIF